MGRAGAAAGQSAWQMRIGLLREWGHWNMDVLARQDDFSKFFRYGRTTEFFG
jgi:hypothetical protein